MKTEYKSIWLTHKNLKDDLDKTKYYFGNKPTLDDFKIPREELEKYEVVNFEYLGTNDVSLGGTFLKGIPDWYTATDSNTISKNTKIVKILNLLKKFVTNGV